MNSVGAITFNTRQIVARDNDTVLYYDLAENSTLSFPSRPVETAVPPPNRKQRRATTAARRRLTKR